MTWEGAAIRDQGGLPWWMLREGTQGRGYKRPEERREKRGVFSSHPRLLDAAGGLGGWPRQRAGMRKTSNFTSPSTEMRYKGLKTTLHEAAPVKSGGATNAPPSLFARVESRLLIPTSSPSSSSLSPGREVAALGTRVFILLGARRLLNSGMGKRASAGAGPSGGAASASAVPNSKRVKVEEGASAPAARVDPERVRYLTRQQEPKGGPVFYW